MLKKLFVLVFLSATTIFTIGYALSSHAQENTAQGLTVSPPLNDVSLKPGQVVTETIRLTNPTQNIVELYPKVMNFESKGEGGDPSFYEAGDTSHKYALAKWIFFDQPKIALAPQQIVEFKYQMTVPMDAEPGGHYGVVFFSSKPPEQAPGASQVAIASMVGSLVLVRVPGDIKEEGLLKSFTSSQGLYIKTPVVFDALIENAGNIHFKPQGEIKIKNMWGSEVENVVFNSARGNVLPDSTRKFEEKWAQADTSFYKEPIGRFTGDLQLTYGEQKKTLNGIVSFWVFPKWFIITIATLLLALALFLIRMIIIKKRRRPFTSNRSGSGPTHHTSHSSGHHSQHRDNLNLS